MSISTYIILEMEIQGTVSSIVFANEETGYRVLRLDNHLTAVGVAPMVAVGAEYKFTGEFVNNAKHGKQFAFTDMVLISARSFAQNSTMVIFTNSEG